MLELLYLSVAPANIPLTVALGVIILYWLMMVSGLIGSDSLNVDTHAGDIGADLHADVAGDLGADVHADADLTISGKDVPTKHFDGGGFSGMMRFANAHRVPLMVVLSIFFLSMWVLAVIANRIFNPGGSVLFGLALYIPNYVLAILATRILTTPLVPLFKPQPTGIAKRSDDLLGASALLRSPLEGSKLAQVELTVDGSEYRLNVRSMDGTRIEQGARIVIVNRDDNSGIYTVRIQ